MSGSAPIVTLTLNPAIDVSSEAETVRHTRKVRTRNEQIEPGGGGINVARVLKRLGADVRAIFLAGGITGRTLDDLLARSGIERTMIEIADDTRLSLTVVERSTGREYRFVPEGPDVTEAEAAAVLDAAAKARCDYLVASGSLSPGLPADFYVGLCSAVAARGGRLVLDTSGEPLHLALEAGGIFLVKPSRGEFEAFVGRKATADGLAREAKALVDAGKAENIAITLGRDGAILVNRDCVRISPAIKVEACSAVGAGDSFTAGMVYGFATGKSAEDAFQYGLAAGAAAVLSSGSDLARPEDLERLVAAAEVRQTGR
jgi:6-phosphofructokinase 2